MVDVSNWCFKSAGSLQIITENRDALLEGVMGIAADIASKSPLAVRGTKEMLVYTRDHSVADGLNFIATWNAGMLSQADVMAALTARMEKKVAKFDS